MYIREAHQFWSEVGDPAGQFASIPPEAFLVRCRQQVALVGALFVVEKAPFGSCLQFEQQSEEDDGA